MLKLRTILKREEVSRVAAQKQYKTEGKSRLVAYLTGQTAENPQTAEEIYEGLVRAGNAPGRSSVYRQLSALVASGEVKRHRAPAPAASDLYQYVGHSHRCDEHFHLHCLRCGSVTHLECACGAEIAEHLFAEHGFVTDRGRTVIYGLCAACAKKEGRTV